MYLPRGCPCTIPLESMSGYDAHLFHPFYTIIIIIIIRMEPERAHYFLDGIRKDLPIN